MFTLKLYGIGIRKIIEAESFLIHEYSPLSFQITTFQRNHEEDKAYYVGNESGAPCKVTDDPWYWSAVIENSAGKTTEVIRPPVPPLPGVTTQSAQRSQREIVSARSGNGLGADA